MAYKKYIQRNGKLYGPYIYQSKRVDGKVVSEYYGSEGVKKNEVVKRNDEVKNRNYRKFFLIFIGVILLGVLVYFIGFSNNNQNNKIAGGVILGLDTSYVKGEPLDGVLKFSLKEGEFVPESSKIVFDNAGNTYEFPLSDIFKETPSEGNYYVDDKDIQGSGLGYGIEGEKIVYPEIEFILQVYNEVSGEETPSEVVPEEVINESLPIETTPEVTPELTTETTFVENTPEEGSSVPMTGQVVGSSGGFFSSLFGLTGRVTMELQKEVNGKVSKDKPFVYDLQNGETAELKLKSVSLNGQELEDGAISLNVVDNTATVTTDYSETEKGYGKDYAGDKEKILSLDLSSLNLSLEEGDLNIKLVYGGEEILQLTTILKEGETNSGEIVEKPVEDIQTPVETPTEVTEPNETIIEENKTVAEIVNSSVWDIGDFLTSQERKVLLDEYGNSSLKTVKSELFKDRIIRGYQFEGYYVEYSYDSSLNKDILEVQMERDRIKFLKDVASSISKEMISPKVLEGYNETYAP